MSAWTKRNLHLLMLAAVSILFQGGTIAIDYETSTSRFLSKDEMTLAVNEGYSYVDKLSQMEETLFKKGIYVKERSHLSRMTNYMKPSKDVIDISRKSLPFIETILYLKKKFALTDREIKENLMMYVENPESKIFSCLRHPICPKRDKYRTIDGSCNSDNKQLYNLGRSASGYRRLLRPVYSDGIYSPRESATDGSPLPFVRNVSIIVFDDQDNPLNPVTNLMMQFGQFINHDMEFTSQFTFGNMAWGL